MPPDHDEGRPGERAASNVNTTDSHILAARDLQDTELALRCAWLRAHAHEMYAVDASGLLSAQLRDFADLIEVAQRHGWWGK